MFDEDNAPLHTSSDATDGEYQQFRQWKDSQSKAAALAQARSEASAAQSAAQEKADRELDAAALQALANKNVSLQECFGSRSTLKGRNAITVIHQLGKGSLRGVYARLRQIAAREGYVQ